ncbi:MAG TPA: nickel pincer cofactor biosynthesis protein LarC [Lachnospiraceae bacterium]|nr:nickel pincer cofactor biosynthesis protein LarC [Lachnospiraceae bacterium]
MKTLYFDCSMGAAGDMLTAALYELLDDDKKTEFLDMINNAGLEGVKSTAEPSVKCGIKGTHMKVMVDGHEEGDHHHEEHHHEDHHHEEHHHGDYNHDDHHHEHTHSHEHHHHHDHEVSHAHSSMHDIERLINDLQVPDRVKQDAVSVYKLIAEAESHAHDRPVTDIHFHEVGTKDAVMDVVSVCLLIYMLKPDKVLSSEINTGSGHVHCAHGILPVPAPATAYILREVPAYQGHIKCELCTPTGAALLKHFVSDFGPMPAMRTGAIGYGMGKKDLEQANCVRVFLGNMGDKEEKVIEYKCNVDDMTPEMMGHAMEVLLGEGALDVYTVQAGMKKSRPGIELNVMCREKDRDRILKLIFKHTTTLGVREYLSRRYTLDRKIEERDTPFGRIRLKTSEGFGVKRQKWEYDDISRIANEKGLSVEEIITGLTGNAED